jgi:hypothetical protein
MYSFKQTPQYIQISGLILAVLIAGVVLGLRGIGVVIGTVALTLPLVLALDALRRRLGRK